MKTLYSTMVTFRGDREEDFCIKHYDLLLPNIHRGDRFETHDANSMSGKITSIATSMIIISDALYVQQLIDVKVK